MNRRKTDIDMNNLKLYIARDEGKWDEDVKKEGELNLSMIHRNFCLI